MKKNFKKRCISLIEILIAMGLIAMITGVIAYNYRGSMDKGKEFKTETAMEKLETVLSMRMSEDPDFKISDWKTAVNESPWVKDANSLIYDGWGQEFTVDADDDGEITITSAKLNAYKAKSKNS